MEVNSTIVAIKNAQVSDYGGKSLNCNPTQMGKIYLDPKIEKTKDLIHWYYNLDDDSRNEFISLTKGVTIDNNPSMCEDYDNKFLNGSTKSGFKD